MSGPLTSVVAARRGRPRKFGAPAHPVTLTLPDHVIEILRAIDTDLSRAVVRLALPNAGKTPHPPAELVTFGRHAVIVVSPTRTLERQVGVELVPLPDGRALISFDRPTTVAELELLIADALDGSRLSPGDRDVFQSVADILKTARRAAGVVLLQRSIIVLESQRRRTVHDATLGAPAASRPGRRTASRSGNGGRST